MLPQLWVGKQRVVNSMANKAVGITQQLWGIIQMQGAQLQHWELEDIIGSGSPTGISTTASGIGSTAMGSRTTASGQFYSYWKRDDSK